MKTTIFLLLSCLPLFAAEYFVDQSGLADSNHFATIQAAIEAAAGEPAIIHLGIGSYASSSPLILSSPDILIQGSGCEQSLLLMDVRIAADSMLANLQVVGSVENSGHCIVVKDAKFAREAGGKGLVGTWLDAENKLHISGLAAPQSGEDAANWAAVSNFVSQMVAQSGKPGKTAAGGIYQYVDDSICGLSNWSRMYTDTRYTQLFAAMTNATAADRAYADTAVSNAVTSATNALTQAIGSGIGFIHTVVTTSDTFVIEAAYEPPVRRAGRGAMPPQNIYGEHVVASKDGAIFYIDLANDATMPASIVVFSEVDANHPAGVASVARQTLDAAWYRYELATPVPISDTKWYEIRFPNNAKLSVNCITGIGNDNYRAITMATVPDTGLDPLYDLSFRTVIRQYVSTVYPTVNISSEGISVGGSGTIRVNGDPVATKSDVAAAIASQYDAIVGVNCLTLKAAIESGATNILVRSGSYYEEWATSVTVNRPLRIQGCGRNVTRMSIRLRQFDSGYGVIINNLDGGSLEMADMDLCVTNNCNFNMRGFFEVNAPGSLRLASMNVACSMEPTPQWQQELWFIKTSDSATLAYLNLVCDDLTVKLTTANRAGLAVLQHTTPHVSIRNTDVTIDKMNNTSSDANLLTCGIDNSSDGSIGLCNVRFKVSNYQGGDGSMVTVFPDDDGTLDSLSLDNCVASFDPNAPDSKGVVVRTDVRYLSMSGCSIAAKRGLVCETSGSFGGMLRNVMVNGVAFETQTALDMGTVLRPGSTVHVDNSAFSAAVSNTGCKTKIVMGGTTMVTTENIADGAVTSDKIGDGSISVLKLSSQVDDRYVHKHTTDSQAVDGPLAIPEITTSKLDVDGDWHVGDDVNDRNIVLANADCRIVAKTSSPVTIRSEAGTVAIDACDQKVSGVAPGDILAGSTDAINGSQLYNASLDAKSETGGAGSLTTIGSGKEFADQSLILQTGYLWIIQCMPSATHNIGAMWTISIDQLPGNMTSPEDIGAGCSFLTVDLRNATTPQTYYVHVFSKSAAAGMKFSWSYYGVK